MPQRIWNSCQQLGFNASVDSIGVFVSQRVPCGTFQKPCAKTFGERCALQGPPEGVVSPNAEKSASLVTNVPCRHLYEGYFHQTILNNCPESTIRHSGSSRRYTSGAKSAWEADFLPDVTRRENRKLRNGEGKDKTGKGSGETRSGRAYRPP